MTSRVISCVAVALAVFAVACGDDIEPTAGRFDEANGDESSPTPTRETKPSSPGATTPAPGSGEPSPALPGDPAPPEQPTDPVTARTCSTAKDLGTISGDYGTGQVVAQGNCNDWVKVRVTEDVKYPVPDALEITATLISPNPDDFDLIAYVNAEADALECTTPTMKSELPSGRSDVLKLQWGEVYSANASDDSRTVSFEIRKKTPGCSVGQWSLLVQGNY